MIIPRLAFLPRFVTHSLLFIALVSTISCGSAPVRFDQLNKGEWKARALIRDKNKRKTNIVYVDMIAERPKNLRMEVTTSFGMNVAVLAMNSETLSLAIVPQRKFFSGKSGAHVLEPLIHISLDPKFLVDFIFDAEPPAPWKCTRDKNNFLQECDLNDAIKVTWSNRELGRKTLDIQSKDHQLQLDLSGFRPNVELNNTTFILEQPGGFTLQRI